MEGNSGKTGKGLRQFMSYDTKERWMSYWYQIREILSLKPKNVLEVGIGTKVVSEYLKRVGVEVTTVDINPELNPDYVCSVTELSRINRKYDVVLCAQVLEHLPFPEFEKALDEIAKICRFAVITLPYGAIDFSLICYLPRKGLKNIFSLKIPFPRKHSSNEHYWEIGKREFPIVKIKEKILKCFEIKKEFYPHENMYHYFFILRSRYNEDM